MKAIRIREHGGIGTLKLEEVPRISITNDQVPIHDAGVNPVDWKVGQGYLKKQLRRQRCDKQVGR